MLEARWGGKNSIGRDKGFLDYQRRQSVFLVLMLWLGVGSKSV